VDRTSKRGNGARFVHLTAAIGVQPIREHRSRAIAPSTHYGPASRSRTPGTLSNERDIEFLLFAFAPGEELSEHTSARPAIVHILEGEGELKVGGDAYPARPGTWLRMAAEVKHSLVARTPMQMALYLLPR